MISILSLKSREALSYAVFNYRLYTNENIIIPIDL